MNAYVNAQVTIEKSTLNAFKNAPVTTDKSSYIVDHHILSLNVSASLYSLGPHVLV